VARFYTPATSCNESFFGERFIGLKTTISLASWRLSSRRYTTGDELSDSGFGAEWHTANFNVLTYLMKPRLRDLRCVRLYDPRSPRDDRAAIFGALRSAHGWAKNLSILPADSVDLVLLIHRSAQTLTTADEHSLESWLGAFTDAKYEAIVNRFQGKM